MAELQSVAQHDEGDDSRADAVRAWYRDRHWVLPVMVLAVGSVSLLLNDIDGRTRQVVSDVISVESALTEGRGGAAGSVVLHAEVARERLVAIVPLLSRLTVAFGAATLLLAGFAAFRSDLPRTIRAVLVAFALYCGFWIFLALH